MWKDLDLRRWGRGGSGGWSIASSLGDEYLNAVHGM